MWYVRQGSMYAFDYSGMNIQNRISAYKIWPELGEKTVIKINLVVIGLLICAYIF